MINAKEEFIEATNGYMVLCAEVKMPRRNVVSGDPMIDTKLKLGYSPDEYEAFLNKLDVTYNSNSYGGQELYGTVWLDKGVWLTRDEDGVSEWWARHGIVVAPPEVPERLKAKA